MTDKKKEMAAKLKQGKAMVDKGATQKEVREQLGLNQSTFSRYLKRSYGGKTMSQVKRPKKTSMTVTPIVVAGSPVGKTIVVVTEDASLIGKILRGEV